MLTPEFVALLWIALGVNLFVFLAALVVPRIRAGLERREQARADALRAAAGPRRPDASDSFDTDAGRPWFPGAPAGLDAAADRASSSVRAASESPATTSWLARLDDETARAARYLRPASLVLIELSGLDRLADRIGAAGAERLIPPLADTIRRQARATDHIAQLGPTRFGVLLVETDEVSAINYIERVRGACDLWLASGAVALRLSIGWSEIRADRTAQVAWVEAEQRLFAERRRAGLMEAEAPAERDGFMSALQPTGS
jgi:diguanylate cyclase (GGDEF)-like protein